MWCGCVRGCVCDSVCGCVCGCVPAYSLHASCPLSVSQPLHWAFRCTGGDRPAPNESIWERLGEAAACVCVRVCEARVKRKSAASADAPVFFQIAVAARQGRAAPSLDSPTSPVERAHDGVAASLFVLRLISVCIRLWRRRLSTARLHRNKPCPTAAPPTLSTPSSARAQHVCVRRHAHPRPAEGSSAESELACLRVNTDTHAPSSQEDEAE